MDYSLYQPNNRFAFFEGYEFEHYRFILIGYNDDMHQTLMKFFPYTYYIERNNNKLFGLYVAMPEAYISWFIRYMKQNQVIFEPDSYINQVNPDDPDYLTKVFNIINNSTIY